jgi:hypothetical protein
MQFANIQPVPLDREKPHICRDYDAVREIPTHD